MSDRASHPMSTIADRVKPGPYRWGCITTRAREDGTEISLFVYRPGTEPRRRRLHHVQVDVLANSDMALYLVGLAALVLGFLLFALLGGGMHVAFWVFMLAQVIAGGVWLIVAAFLTPVVRRAAARRLEGADVRQVGIVVFHPIRRPANRVPWKSFDTTADFEKALDIAHSIDQAPSPVEMQRRWHELYDTGIP